MFCISTKITQDTIRLTGYSCSRPETKRTIRGDVLAWQYYRRGLASDTAAHVSVEFNKKCLCGVVRIAAFDPIAHELYLESSKTIYGTLDDLVCCAADALDELKEMQVYDHERNLAAALLYDNGFLPGDEGGTNDGGRYWVRDDRFFVDCWHIIRPASKARLIENPDDDCEVNFGAIQIGGWTAVRCPNLRMAIGMLDSGMIPRPKKKGFAKISFDTILSAANA